MSTGSKPAASKGMSVDMAYPTITTCTKCGKPATMKRREAAALRPAKDRPLEVDTTIGYSYDNTKMGYSYEVSCPHCGFQFTSRPKGRSI